MGSSLSGEILNEIVLDTVIEACEYVVVNSVLVRVLRNTGRL
jgi:hypothetical protein